MSITIQSGDPNVLKGLGIGIALTTFAQTTANFTITNYAVMIFEKAGTSIDPYVSSILLAVALILGSLFSTCLADILGRKILNIISLFGSAFGLFAVSLFHYLNRNGYDLSAFAFVPAASLSFVIFISAAGIMPLSMVCSVEYLPAKVFENQIIIFNENSHFILIIEIVQPIFFPGSNLWNGNNLFYNQSCYIHVRQTLSDSFGHSRFTRMSDDLCGRVHLWGNFCDYCRRRNYRSVT